MKKNYHLLGELSGFSCARDEHECFFFLNYNSIAACMAGGAKVLGSADHQQKIRARPAQVQKIQVVSMKLKVHKIENFFGSEFEFYTISLLVMLKY